MCYSDVSGTRRIALSAALGILALVGALLASLPTAGAQPSVPAEPVDVTATPGNQQITLAWTPGDDGGSTIIRYEYTYDENGVPVNVWYPIPGSTRHTTNYTVTGLTNGVTYWFQVRAVNAIGPGATQPDTTAPEDDNPEDTAPKEQEPNTDTAPEDTAPKEQEPNTERAADVASGAKTPRQKNKSPTLNARRM